MSREQRSVRLAIEGGEPAIRAADLRTWPDIREQDRLAILRVLDRGILWGAHAPEVTRLQEEWADYVGVRYCLAVNSGTAALHCAVAACGLGPGDEVIVPTFTFIATPMAVAHNGATPVFCDVDAQSFNLDVKQAELLITDRTKAIMPVHLHGLPADMAEINALAQRYSLKVIEDAAQAHGAIYHGKKIGSLGFCAGFSLNGSKNLSAAEGGLFVTDDEEAYVAARRLAIFGEDTPPTGPGEYRAYWSYGVGWNYRTHELTAALARSQLSRMDEYNRRAQENAAALTEKLAGLTGLILPLVPDDRTSVWNRYRIRLDAKALGYYGSDIEFRDRLLYALNAEGVPASTWQLLPVSASPVFRRGKLRPALPGEVGRLDDWDPTAFPVTTKVLNDSIVISGPEAHALMVQTDATIDAYARAIRKVLDRLDVVLESDYIPVRVKPEIPTSELVVAHKG